MSLRIISWNVLHIVHELNYVDNSPVIQKYPIEKNRIELIYKKIMLMIDGSTIISLQEVPFDLLQLLLNNKNNYNIEFHKYRRLPSIKNPDIVNPYIDSSEHLVTIYPIKLFPIIKSSFDLDNQSKGALIIKFNNGITVVNVHVPIIQQNIYIPDDSRKTLFKTIINTVKDDNYIIIGDFNSKNYQLKKDMYFNKNIIIPKIDGNTRKCIKNNKIVYTKLDHIILNNIDYIITFIDNEEDDLSDHKYIGIIV